MISLNARYEDQAKEALNRYVKRKSNFKTSFNDSNSHSASFNRLFYQEIYG